MFRAINRCAAAIAILLCGCSIRPDKQPVLFQNEKLESTAEGERMSDIENCLTVADQNVHLPNQYRIIARQAFFSSIAGTVPGAVGGAIIGETSENVAVGAAVGLIVGSFQGVLKLYEDHPYYQRFVEHCLHKKGYEIIGWKTK